MRTYYKIYQIDSQVEILNPKTQSSYSHDLYAPLDATEYNTKNDAINALKQYLNQNPNDNGEFTIWELYSN